MGTFYTGCRIENVAERSRGALIPKMIVDPRKKRLVAAGPLPAA